MTYEALLKEADSHQLTVKEKPLKQFDGLIHGNKIAIRKDIPTNAEKACVLAEELGHYYTSSGNIIDQSTIANQKQELRARAWAYDKQIGLSGIIECFEYGCRNRHEMADYLEVTEMFLEEALCRYHQKYGLYAISGKYIIYFEPNLTVMKLNKIASMF